MTKRANLLFLLFLLFLLALLGALFSAFMSGWSFHRERMKTHLETPIVIQDCRYKNHTLYLEFQQGNTTFQTNFFLTKEEQ